VVYHTKGNKKMKLTREILQTIAEKHESKNKSFREIAKELETQHYTVSTAYQTYKICNEQIKEKDKEIKQLKQEIETLKKEKDSIAKKSNEIIKQYKKEIEELEKEKNNNLWYGIGIGIISITGLLLILKLLGGLL
jgi:ElaB/YqjD/DUF883 family membrane-anchored ribosome-binding protein